MLHRDAKLVPEFRVFLEVLLLPILHQINQSLSTQLPRHIYFQPYTNYGFTPPPLPLGNLLQPHNHVGICSNHKIWQGQRLRAMRDIVHADSREECWLKIVNSGFRFSLRKRNPNRREPSVFFHYSWQVRRWISSHLRGRTHHPFGYSLQRQWRTWLQLDRPHGWIWIPAHGPLQVDCPVLSQINGSCHTYLIVLTATADPQILKGADSATTNTTAADRRAADINYVSVSLQISLFPETKNQDDTFDLHTVIKLPIDKNKPSRMAMGMGLSPIPSRGRRTTVPTAKKNLRRSRKSPSNPRQPPSRKLPLVIPTLHWPWKPSRLMQISGKLLSMGVCRGWSEHFLIFAAPGGLTAPSHPCKAFPRF